LQAFEFTLINVRQHAPRIEEGRVTTDRNSRAVKLLSEVFDPTHPRADMVVVDALGTRLLAIGRKAFDPV
jgi:hypothetical protein